MSEELLELANKRLIRAEFLVASRVAGVRPDALDAAYTLADMSGVAIDEHGKVWGIDDAIDALKQNSSYLFLEPEKTKPSLIGGPSGYNLI